MSGVALVHDGQMITVVKLIKLMGFFVWGQLINDSNINLESEQTF